MTAEFKYSKYVNDKKEIIIVLLFVIIIFPIGFIRGSLSDNYFSLKWQSTNLVTFLGIIGIVKLFEWLLWKLAGGYKTYSRWD